MGEVLWAVLSTLPLATPQRQFSIFQYPSRNIYQRGTPDVTLWMARGCKLFRIKGG